MGPSGRLSWVDTGRGIAITLVVLFHTRNWVAGTGVDVGAWADINTFLSSLRMPLFFTLSGLFAAKWLSGSWASLLRVKVLLFAWVLAVWAVIGITVQVSGLAAAGQKVAVTSAIKDLLLTPISPPYELWFIWALAVFFIVAKATRAVPGWVQLAIAGLISAIGLTLWFSTTTGVTGSLKFYFFFLAGIYLRSAVLFLADSSLWLRTGALAAWAAFSFVLVLLDWREVPALYFLNCVLGVLGGVALSTFLTWMPLLARLGKNTLSIYLAHTPIVILITIVLFLVPPLLSAVGVLGGLIVPAVAAIAIAAALGLHRVSRGTPLRYLYEPPPLLVRVLGGTR